MTRATLLLCGLLAAAAGAPHQGHAQAASTAAATAPGPSAGPGTAEARIAALQQAMQITAEQLPQWNSFAEAMRDNAAATDALFRDRAANARMMNAADNMKSYAAVARAYADDTQKLSDSFVVLYGVLSDRQKELADTIFRQQSAPAPNSTRR